MINFLYIKKKQENFLWECPFEFTKRFAIFASYVMLLNISLLIIFIPYSFIPGCKLQAHCFFVTGLWFRSLHFPIVWGASGSISLGTYLSSPHSLLNIHGDHRVSNRSTFCLSINSSGPESPWMRRFIWHVGAIHVDGNLGCWSRVTIPPCLCVWICVYYQPLSSHNSLRSLQ